MSNKDGHQRRMEDHEEFNHELHAAADHAVRKVFAILGVDIDKPESVEEFREDLRFGKRLRKAANQGQLVLVGVIVVGLCGAAWLGLVGKIKGGG